MKIFGALFLSAFAWFVFFVLFTAIDKKNGKDYAKEMNSNAGAAVFAVIVIWLPILGIYFLTK